jgi:hypothetical protein
MGESLMNRSLLQSQGNRIFWLQKDSMYRLTAIWCPGTTVVNSVNIMLTLFLAR